MVGLDSDEDFHKMSLSGWKSSERQAEYDGGILPAPLIRSSNLAKGFRPVAKPRLSQ